MGLGLTPEPRALLHHGRQDGAPPGSCSGPHRRSLHHLPHQVQPRCQLQQFRIQVWRQVQQQGPAQGWRQGVHGDPNEHGHEDPEGGAQPGQAAPGPLQGGVLCVLPALLLERLYDVVNMKMEIDYDAKNFKSGVMTANAKYIITHHDYTQETGTIKIEGDGKNVVLQVIPKEEVLTKTVFRPVEVKFTFMPKQLKMVFTQEKMTFETFFVQRGQVFETQMTYKSEFEPTCQMTMRMDVGKQKIEFTRSENDVMKTNMVMEMQGSRGANFEQLTGTMKLTGTMEATRWWTEGTPVDFVIKKN